MKGMKGRILKKLRSIPKLGEPKQTPRILRVHASDGSPTSPPPVTPLGPRQLHLDEAPCACRVPGRTLQELPVVKEFKFQDQQQQEGHRTPSPNSRGAGLCNSTPPPFPEPDIIDVAELMKDLEEEDADDDDDGGLDEISDKENIRPGHAPWSAWAVTEDGAPPPPAKRRQPLSSSTPSPRSGSRGPPRRWCATPTSELLDDSPFRRPDPNSANLFDPDLLVAFEQAVMDHIRSYRREDGGIDLYQLLEQISNSEVSGTQTGATDNICEQEEDGNPWRGFELRCPPGGEDTVVLYTTTLRGIRKTFEDCGSVRFLLGCLRVRFCERDVSMHLGYREELWRVLGDRAVPPRLFVRGRYIGGADEVLGLHERGRLLPLLQGLPVDRPGGAPCRGCGGVGFVVCGGCSGSRKMVGFVTAEAARCPSCNENGLVVCALCSS
ncbi:hypothetical protein Taro_035634 [Colocasia esculenta]|uniref:Glutaredoxin domain-containing protein n=1 Tax=Colocasia esculenta TaxID=4460 RepID=A0A843VZF8_COLES|nr:hypothetical protein [Colocasia esculenta]